MFTGIKNISFKKKNKKLNIYVNHHESQNRNSLSDSKTSRSEGTVWMSDVVAASTCAAWLSIPIILLLDDDDDVSLDFDNFVLSRALGLLVLNSTPALGPKLLLLLLLDGWAAVCATLSALRSFTLNLQKKIF